MKGIRKKKVATCLLVVFGLLGFFLQQFGENLLGSLYTIYLAPWLEAKVYYVFANEFAGNNTVDITEIHQVHILWVLLIVLSVLLIVIWLVGKYYRAVSATRLTQEQMLSNAMQAMINDEKYILSAQLYRYEIANEYLNNIRGKRIIINHINSHYQPGMDINAVVHEEFIIPEKTYRMVKRFSKQINKYETSKLISDKESAEKIVDKYINEKKRFFQTLALQEVKEEDCVDYIIYKGIQCVLGRETMEDKVEGVGNEVSESLLHSKRTGCIPAILLQSVHVFRNGQSSFKKNRAYWSFSPNKEFLPMGYRDLLIVLTIPYDHIEKRDGSFLNEDLVTTVNSFLADYVIKEARINARNYQ